MDLAATLLELSRHPLPDSTLATVVRALAQCARIDRGASRQEVLVNEPLSGELPQGFSFASEPSGLEGRHFKRITVKDCEGQRTTVCLPWAFFQTVCEHTGGPRKATAWVRELSREAPLNVQNRSGWVQDRIQESVRSKLHRGSLEAKKLSESSTDTRTLPLFPSS